MRDPMLIITAATVWDWFWLAFSTGLLMLAALISIDADERDA